MRSTLTGRAARLCAGVCCALALTAAGPLHAQEAATAAATRPELRQLKSRVEQRFQVVLLRRGLVLVPKQEQKTFSSIELAEDGLVLIDGTAVTGRELRARVPADADVVAQLSFLDGATRRTLFAPIREPDRPSAAMPPAAPAPPESPDLPDAVTPPEPLEHERRDDGWIERERYRRGGARVRVGGDIWVKEDEAVGDAVVAILGTARIDGRVDGDVVAVGGGVILGPRADIRGNVVAVGGAVERQPGSRVQGDLNEVRIGMPAFGPFIQVRPWRQWGWFGSPFGSTTDLLASLLRMAIVGLLGAMIVALGGRPVRRVAGFASAEPWRAALAGLAAQLFFIPVLVLTIIVLAVSIVGIPLLLLVPFGLLAAIFALFLGFTGVGCAVGDAIGRRTGRSAQNLLASLVIGLALIWALTVIARFGGLAGPPIRFVLGFVLAAGFIVEYVAWTVGLGAVLLSRFGRRGPAGGVPPLPDSLEIDQLPSSTA